MALIDDAKLLAEAYKQQSATLEHNKKLFEIYEGELLKYVVEALSKQLSPQSLEATMGRIAPINILKRLVSKLSKIYVTPPVRDLESDDERDIELFNNIQEELEIDSTFQIANEFFNLFKNDLLEIYLYKSRPAVRTIPSDRIILASNDATEPTKPTHIGKIICDYKDANGTPQKMIYGYTANSFFIMNQDGELLLDRMAEKGNPNGVNPFGVLPFVYTNRSKHSLVPTPDSDTLEMTKLIPILLTDLNYSVKFQSFSILYGVDVDSTNLKMSPNAFWQFKSDAESGKTPQVGSIKPEVDIDQVLNFIAAQVSLWFQTRNIKAGAMSDLSVQNAASAISKVVDEADTSEDRTIQTRYFMEAEADLWDKVLNYMHPTWMRIDPNYIFRGQAFTGLQSVKAVFPEQKAMVDRSKLIDDNLKLVNAKMITKEQALSELYPDKTEEEIDEMLVEAEAAATIQVHEATEDVPPPQSPNEEPAQPNPAA